MAKKVIIIGGGLAGLSAGCYAAMNGFETQIFEHHSVPGGGPTPIAVPLLKCGNAGAEYHRGEPQAGGIA